MKQHYTIALHRFMIPILGFCSLQSQVVISEVMYNPMGTDSPNEFVEIVNLGSVAIDLSDWQIADDSYTDSFIGENLQLGPDQYAVILEQDYVDDEGSAYEGIIPPGVLTLTVDDTSIGNGLKNSGDHVHLINTAGEIVSSVEWESGQEGFSIERVVLDYPEIPVNWRESIQAGGTPGFLNSVASFVVDAAIDSVLHEPLYPSPGESARLIIHMSNEGLFDCQADMLINGIVESFLTIDSQQSQSMEYWTDPSPGLNRYELIIQAEVDWNPANDTLNHIIRASYPTRSMEINEIQYAPLSGFPEWIEIVNVSATPIQLEQWSVNDQEMVETGLSVSYWLDPGGLAVISGDWSPSVDLTQDGFPGLNNTGDNIYLMDPTGRMIDHVQYRADWGGGGGKSLERVTWSMDSNLGQNWGTCTDPAGSTPGVVNSLYVSNFESEESIRLSPNPFSPDGDGFEDELIIAYHLPFTESTMTVVIYDVRGREIITLAPGTPTGTEGILRWDGTTGERKPCPMGQYIVSIDAADLFSGKSHKMRERIILARTK